MFIGGLNWETTDRMLRLNLRVTVEKVVSVFANLPFCF